MKKALAIALFVFLCAIPAASVSQTSEFKTRKIGPTTSDTIIDSLQVGKYQRLYINYVFFWYDNAANTNAINIELVEGMSQVATQGSGRLYRYQEAMTSGGVKGVERTGLEINTTADSTVYVVLSAASSDSLMAIYTYKIMPE